MRNRNVKWFTVSLDNYWICRGLRRIPEDQREAHILANRTFVNNGFGLFYYKTTDPALLRITVGVPSDQWEAFASGHEVEIARSDFEEVSLSEDGFELGKRGVGIRLSNLDGSVSIERTTDVIAVGFDLSPRQVRRINKVMSSLCPPDSEGFISDLDLELFLESGE